MRLKIFALALLSCVAIFAAPKPVVAGPEVIFPLSASLPFPWAKIEGIWETNENGIDAVYSFEVQGIDKKGRKILKVVHLDPYTFEVMAEGIGITIESYPVVRAAMRGKTEHYFLIIGSYFNRDANRGPAIVTVLTKRPFNAPYEEGAQAIVDKVSNIPLRLTKPISPRK